MGQTRVYCKGVLEAEGFPVSEVSEHLERAGHRRVGRPVRAVAGPAARAGRRARPPRAGGRGRPRAPPAAQARPLRHPPVPVVPRRAGRRRGRQARTRPRSTPSSTSAGSSPCARTTASRWSPSWQRWDRSPDLAASRRQLPALRPARRDRRRLLRRRPGLRRVLRRGQRGHLLRDARSQPSEQRHWFQMRQALVRFHRLVVPMREAVSGLMRREHSRRRRTSSIPYYQDVYDHVLRVSESTEALRDLVSTIVETNLSLRDYRQNQVMKKVTSWAAIIAVPTLITGYYGMNVPYPDVRPHVRSDRLAAAHHRHVDRPVRGVQAQGVALRAQAPGSMSHHGAGGRAHRGRPRPPPSAPPSARHRPPAPTSRPRRGAPGAHRPSGSAGRTRTA